MSSYQTNSLSKKIQANIDDIKYNKVDIENKNEIKQKRGNGNGNGNGNERDEGSCSSNYDTTDSDPPSEAETDAHRIKGTFFYSDIDQIREEEDDGYDCLGIDNDMSEAEKEVEEIENRGSRTSSIGCCHDYNLSTRHRLNIPLPLLSLTVTSAPDTASMGTPRTPRTTPKSVTSHTATYPTFHSPRTAAHLTTLGDSSTSTSTSTSTLSKAAIAASAQRTAAAQRTQLLTSTISKLEEAGLLPDQRNNYGYDDIDVEDVENDHIGIGEENDNENRDVDRDGDLGRDGDEDRDGDQNNQTGRVSSLTWRDKGYGRDRGNRGHKVGFGPTFPEVSITRERSNNLPQHSEILSLSPPRRRLSSTHQIGTGSNSRRKKSILESNSNSNYRNVNQIENENKNENKNKNTIENKNVQRNNNGNNNLGFDEFVDMTDIGYKIENDENDDFDVGTDSDESLKSSPLALLSMIRVTSFSAFSSAPIYDAEDAERRIGKLRKERRRQVALTEEFIRLRLLFARNSISLLISKAVKKRSNTI